MAYNSPNGTIEYQAEDSIAWVILNQPENRNTLDGKMQHDLADVWPEINEDESVRVVIVAANGECFSDGQVVDPEPRASVSRQDWLRVYTHQPTEDLEELGLSPSMDSIGLHQMGIPDRTKGRPAKPMIVAIHGACAGAALEFVSFADIVLCADDAEFFDRSASVGDAPLEEMSSLMHLRSLRRLIALRMAYEGDGFKIDAQRAYQLGMATDVAPREQLRERARELAGYMLEASPAAIRAVVAGHWDPINMPYGQARMITSLFAQQAREIDGKEGYLAWDEGRDPVWPSLSSWANPWPAFRLRPEAQQ
jgi:enoyl-CoA hydratase/carnithine racemase